MRALLLSLVLLLGMGTIAHAGMNGPVCKSNPCTLNEPGGWQDKWFAKVDGYAAKGIRFKTLPSKATSFWGQYNAWMRGQRSFPTGYCLSACAMTAGKLYNEGRIKIDPNTWLCFCHTGGDYRWGILATADEYDGKWFDALVSGKPFKLKDVR